MKNERLREFAEQIVELCNDDRKHETQIARVLNVLQRLSFECDESWVAKIQKGNAL